MRYIGGKSKLLGPIHDLIKQKTQGEEIHTFLDLFAGTGCVGASFKPDYTVYANDKLYFSYILLAGTLEHNTPPSFKGLAHLGIDDPLDYLNTCPVFINSDSFIYHQYSPAGADKRMYFTPGNAARIDTIRQLLRRWKQAQWITPSEFNYLLCALIEAVPYVSNTTGTYGAYLKHWDARALKPLTLIHPILVNNGRDVQAKAFHLDAAELCEQLDEVDVCYIDPPYNARQYTSNYHLLETIARYDAPEIKGVTGVRRYESHDKSRFCRKNEAYAAMEEVIRAVPARHIVVSYSSGGILSVDEISQVLKTYGQADSFRLVPIVYDAYQSKRTESQTVNEYLFYIRKEKQA